MRVELIRLGPNDGAVIIRADGGTELYIPTPEGCDHGPGEDCDCERTSPVYGPLERAIVYIDQVIRSGYDVAGK